MELPALFEENIKALLGNDYNSFVEALQSSAPTSIRINSKTQIPVSDLSPVLWCETGYYLNERPLFTADPLFHAGSYYVQEASSMFVEQAIKQHVNKPVNMLDLCAAPGGKSTHLSSLLPVGSLLVSNEIIRSRAHILSENVQKWGNGNVVVTNNNSADFGKLYSFFDAVLVDAPCSGEGMFRKDEGAITEWSPQNVVKCVERQREIVSTVWPSLKRDGMLIYSTCTYNRQENEENVQWIMDELGAELLTLDIPEEWGITLFDAGYRFFPHKTCGEGFFLSVLRKKTEDYGRIKGRKERKQSKISVEIGEKMKKQLLFPDQWEVVFNENMIKALPASHAEDIELIGKMLNVMYSGIHMAEQKGKDLIPQASLALSKHINPEMFNCVDVDVKTALRFLQKEMIEIPETERGYVLLTYQGVPLGWVKNLGNRVNNLYPQEWRIRMKMSL